MRWRTTMNRSEKARVQLACQIALNNVSEQLKNLEGKDKFALQSEWLEMSCLDTDEYEDVEFLDIYNYWGS